MMWVALSVVVLGAGALVSFVLSRLYISFALDRNVLDVPNHRSSHSAPVPRGGGVSFALPAALTVLVMMAVNGPTRGLWIGLAGALPLMAVGWIDDVRGVSNRWRFAVQILSAGWAVAIVHRVAGEAGPGPALWARIALEIVFIVWMINLFNFMDGIDGIAAGQAAVGLSFAAVFLFGRSEVLGALLIWFAGLALGFLFTNWAPARVFMGDVGSTFLGFLLGTLAVWTLANATAPSAVWILSTAPFFVDATATLVRRVLGGERWWTPHRRHLYQRLVDTGRTHPVVAAGYIGAALVSGLGASALVQLGLGAWPVAAVILLALMFAYSMLMAGLDRSPDAHTGSE